MMACTYRKDGGIVTEIKRVNTPKGLDAFQATIFTGLQWLTKNQRALYLVTLPVLLVLVGGFGWSYYASHLKEKRQNELAKIDMLWQEEGKSIDTQRQSMQKLIDAIPAAKKDDKAKGKSNAETAAERQRQGIQDQMAALKADHSKSLAEYKSFYTKHEGEPEGWAAGLRVAAEGVKAQKYDEAEPILTKIIAKSVSKPFYQIHARLLYMALLEDKGDYAKAIEVADTAAKLSDKELIPVILLSKGRLQWLSNATPDAVATLDSIIKDYASSPEADKARGLRAIL